MAQTGRLYHHAAPPIADPSATVGMAPTKDNSPNHCGQCTQIVVIFGGFGLGGWLCSLEGTTQIVAGSVVGTVFLCGLIGTGRAVLKHERVWWVCTPVHGLFMIIAWILLLPFAIKTYCVVLCKFCKKNTAETEVTSDHAQAQAVAAAYAAGMADAESCAADAAKLAQPEKEPVSVVVEGTVLDVPTPNAQPDDAV